MQINNWLSILDPILDAPGGILYSSYDTLVRGDFYLMGVNPGGSGGTSIKEDLFNLPQKTSNEYLDECWENKGGRYKKGDAPLQRRIKWLFGQLGCDIRKICASNLIFVKSEKVSDINFFELADMCWPVHEQIIEIVKPKTIIVFGNSGTSPYAYIKRKVSNLREQKPIKSGHGSWKCKSLIADFDHRQTYVAGLPHMSRYSPINRAHVIKWLNLCSKYDLALTAGS